MIGPIVVDGILLGSLLSLASVGLGLSYAVFRFPNFAHGDLLTVGAYAAWVGASLAGAGDRPAVSLIAGAGAALLAGIAVILAADTLVLRPMLARRRHGSVIIVSFALGLLLRNLLVLFYGPGEIALDRDIEIARPIALGPVVLGRLTTTEQAVILALVPVMLGLHMWLNRTPTGRDLRAFAENPDLAGLCGLAVPPLRRLAWGLSGALCGLTGWVIILLGPAQPGGGAEYMLPALAVVVLGGINSVWGALGAALLLGLMESAIVHLGFAEWRQLATFAVVIVVLAARPPRFSGRYERAGMSGQV